MAGEFDKHIVRVSFGKKNLGKSDNVNMGWAQFIQRFKKPVQTREKHSRYRQESIEEKNRLKGIGGWFLGAHVEGGKRKASNVKARDIITLDLDNISVEEYESIVKHKNHWLNQFECFIHTTRSHTPEDPRMRVILLAGSEISVEKYEALTRIMAWHVDDRMETVDPVSFRIAQMMYMPTISADQEYKFGRNPGKLVDVDEMLDSWQHNWRDMSQLPRAEREEKAREREIAAEDPTEKPGIIGAFCRAYSIEDAIAEFLPDVYGDPDPNSTEARYTYLGGHSMYGAVIYDDKFMYSWHGTDPACEQLCNAWDLVRIHKFHEKDEKKDVDTPVGDLPSQKAMIEFAKLNQGVQTQLLEDSLDFDAMFDNLDEVEDPGHIQAEEDTPDDFGLDDDESRELLGLPPKNDKLAGLPDFPGKRKPVKTSKKWFHKLETTDSGKVLPTTHNLTIVMVHDKRARGLMAYNAFTGNIVATRPIVCQIPEIPKFEIHDKMNGDLWTGDHDAAFKAILSAPRGEGKIGYGIQAPDNALQEAITNAAGQFKFHPLIDHLLKLPDWDGEERISKLWIDYMGTPDTAYHRETATLFMVAALARVFCPGIAWDYVPILMGKENARKSTFVQDLAFGHWGGELSADLHNQQLVTEQIKAKWILEMAEITGIKRSDAEMQKAFITRTTEVVRLSYDRRAREFPRQCVFIGTTNEHTFLTAAQNRRFWPIKLGVDVIDNDKLRRELDQMWAEALVEFKKRYAAAGNNVKRIYFGLSKEAVREAQTLQNSIRLETSEDSDAPAIQDFLEKPISLGRLTAQDGFEDLDEEDVTVLRVSTNAEQCHVEALGREMPTVTATKNMVARSVNSALHSVPGWVSIEDWAASRGITKDKLTVPGYSRSRGFVRANATAVEITQGYRVIEIEEEEEDLL